MHSNALRVKWATVIAAVLVMVAIMSAQPPTTGAHRLAFDQAATPADLKQMTWTIYVDGTRSLLAGVACAPAAAPNTSTCIANFPSMTPGPHTIELGAVQTIGAETFESARSVPLPVRFIVIATPTGLRVVPPGQGIL